MKRVLSADELKFLLGVAGKAAPPAAVCDREPSAGRARHESDAIAETIKTIARSLGGMEVDAASR